MDYQDTNVTTDELNAATDILIAVIAIDNKIDQTEVNQFKLQLNGASFNSHTELKQNAIAFVENDLSACVHIFDHKFIMERSELVKSQELRQDVVMAAIAISFADRHYHENERSAVNALREAWSV